MSGPQAHWLPDGRRLHLNHGPIDLVVEAFGAPAEMRLAYGQAATRFQTILNELVEELRELRRPAEPTPRHFAGSTARRMEAAVCAHTARFITPMAAVAGSVADEILAAMLGGRRLDRAYVNHGGDIALHLSPGTHMTLAVAGTGNGFADRVVIRAGDGVGGVATSGWRGRSFSLGIADAVTVLAATGAEADAAATVIANAVDLPGHPSVRREPAVKRAPDSDLGDRLVTVDVGVLTGDEVAQALKAGLVVAERLRRQGLIVAAALFLQGETLVCGNMASHELPRNTVLDATPLWPAGHLPRKGGDQQLRRHRVISPLEGEMAGRPEGGRTACYLAASSAELCDNPIGTTSESAANTRRTTHA